MSIPKYEATQRLALIQHDPQDQRRQVARDSTPGGVSAAIVAASIAVVLAVFWASLAWIVWGTLAAIIVTVVVLVVSVFTMGLLRSAVEIESPDDVAWHPALRQAA